MQRVFYAHSFFTEQTNQHLVSGLDHILRAISNESKYDGYTHQKLSVAFRDFQYYLYALGEDNHMSDEFEWNTHELLVIPLTQFERIIANSAQPSGLDYHAIRLIKALLQHGLNQERSPKSFCELPPSVNAEFGDYLSLTLSSKLGIRLPDRLDDMQTGDIACLCNSAWDELDSPIQIGFLTRVRFLLQEFLGVNN